MTPQTVFEEFEVLSGLQKRQQQNCNAFKSLKLRRVVPDMQSVDQIQEVDKTKNTKDIPN